MLNSREQLGEFVKSHRELRNWTQDDIVTPLLQKSVKINRSIVAHLEQGLRVPKPEVLQSICEHLQIPHEYWQPFTNPSSLQRFEFEEALSELVGLSMTLDGHDDGTRVVAEQQISGLLSQSGSGSQTRDRLNSILTFYGVSPVSLEFFDRYLTPKAFGSNPAFEDSIRRYQKDAIRLFSTLPEAYREFNRPGHLSALLSPIQLHSLARFTDRIEWNAIEEIPDQRLPDLGYISARRVKQESKEREALCHFLEELAGKIRGEGKAALDGFSAKMKKRMDTLLRKFRSTIPHGLFSPLFAPDPDELLREAIRIAPKSDDELATMQATQETAMRNLARYLSADHLDVYVATSMRNDADFVSVNSFAKALFAHDSVRPLKLRFFNPTQSWIEDRIAKGLVEALMLRRAEVTIYMAQKSDTFGKDSEASVALGQGKPVVVYVPKLVLPDKTDAETLFRQERIQLVSMLDAADQTDIDDAIDIQGIASRILHSKLAKCTDDELADLARMLWADFDLHNEADRIEDLALKAEYREWLDCSLEQKSYTKNFSTLRIHVTGILVANAISFEQRAMLFREVHPLALQVILSTGVLNGILVVRSVQQCAHILSALLSNDLRLDLKKDELNYRLIEEVTHSTIRVISRHRLLRHSFQTFYGRP